jgi:predicted nuclease of restriction endonuclease-like (RecB) superfamily
VFSLVYYLYISLKLILTGITSKKLLNLGSEYIFVGYNKEITKQLKVYYLDLGYTVTLLVVNIDESK